MDFMTVVGVVGWILATAFALALMSKANEQDRASRDEETETEVAIRLWKQRFGHLS